MIKRITYAMQRLGNLMFPLPAPDRLASEAITAAKREALVAEGLAEVYEAEARRERIRADMLRARVARLQGGAVQEPLL